MTQRRILIGSMIGILVFTILSWIGDQTWMALETQLLQGQSALRFFNPYNKANFTIVNFDEQAQINLFEKEVETQKEFILSLVTELAVRGVSSISFLQDKKNFYDIENIDLEIYIGDYDTNIQTLSLKDIEYKWQNEKGNWKLLDRTSSHAQSFDVSELLAETIPFDELKNTNIILVSPKSEANSDDLNLLINYIDDRKVSFVHLANLILFIISLAAGILMASMIYWARIVAFFTLSALTLLFSQTIFSFLNIHIETIPIVSSLLGILVLTNLFDLNIMAFRKKDIFHNDKSPELKTIADLKDKKAQQVSHNQNGFMNTDAIFELRNKYYNEHETNLEDIALEFEEKTVKSINGINEKLDELDDSNTLVDRDRIKLSLLRHNFNNMTEEIDAILFNLVPFRFEGKQGLINLLELYASKLFLLSKGKLRISIETQFPVIKLEKMQKINAYRILQKLIELIKVANEDNLFNGLNIGIIIIADKENKIRFKISYEGMPIDEEKSSFKLQDIYKRVKAIENAELNLGTEGAAKLGQSLTNHIEFKIQDPKGSLTLASATY